MRVLVGNVLPMTARGARANAIAFDGGRIVAVGDRADVIAAAGPGARVTEVAAVLPGFIDAHHHLALAVFYGGCLDVRPSAAPSIDRVIDLVRREAASLPEGAWVVGQGYDEFVLAEARHPTREDLDRACPDRPVFLLHYSCHEGVANTRALELAGIDRAKADPHGGVIERTRGGAPTGRLVEAAMSPVEAMARANRLARAGADFVRALSLHEARLFEVGITRVVDAAVSPELEALYRRAKEEGVLRVAVTMFPISPAGWLIAPRDRIAAGARTGDGSDDLAVGPVKLVFDGANRCAICMTLPRLFATAARTLASAVRRRSLAGVRLARQTDPRVVGARAEMGILFYDEDSGAAIVRAAMNEGFAVASHAIGNQAIANVLAAYASTRLGERAGFPPRIEHGHFVDRDLVARMRDQGVAVVTQPDFLTMPSLDHVTVPVGLKYMPLRAMLDAGVRVAGSSDHPVLPSFAPLDGVRAAVARKTCGGARIHAEEAIDPEDALAMYTREAAWASGCLATSGTLEPGKRADLVVLSHDPLDAPAEVTVKATVLAGEIVWGDALR